MLQQLWLHFELPEWSVLIRIGSYWKLRTETTTCVLCIYAFAAILFLTLSYQDKWEGEAFACTKYVMTEKCVDELKAETSTRNNVCQDQQVNNILWRGSHYHRVEPLIESHLRYVRLNYCAKPCFEHWSTFRRNAVLKPRASWGEMYHLSTSQHERKVPPIHGG